MAEAKKYPRYPEGSGAVAGWTALERGWYVPGTVKPRPPGGRREELSERIVLLEGDIVEQAVDAIVNAANRSLLGGGGVDGAIHRAAGPGLLEECEALGGCPTGQARTTGGHRLKAKRVIHVVGPFYRDGKHGEPDQLRSAYRKSLELAEAHHCRSIAFPAISTGAYRYPKREAAQVALEEARSWIESHALPARLIFVLFGREDLEIYRQELERLAGSKG
jgi:O-acetyl-ADP-ribose deacetylase (regulator of RNase III)